MKQKGRKHGPALAPSLPTGPRTRTLALYVCLGGLILLALVYGPALHGGFVFDDLNLPFQLTLAATPLAGWLVGARPVLMSTYWANFQLSANNPFSYHVVNLLIHALNGAMVFLVLARLLSLAGWARERSRAAALAGSAIFLLHPLATESVSYIAGRSESLAALFMLAAYTLFLYRREDSWKSALAIAGLFALGVAAKENAVALAGVFLLTSWIFPGRPNRRLYAILAPGAAAAIVVVLRSLMHGGNAGFSIHDFTWYQYTFTQARAIFTYLRLAILPFGQSVDHDFPISFTIAQHGAWLCALALAGLLGLALGYRRRFPLACFGLLLFLVLLAPTSSVVPIADALVERRMYLPLLGLILIGCEAASRVRLSRPAAYSAIATVLLLFAMLSHERNRLWGDPEKLLASAALQAPHNPRPVANLTDTLIAANRCTEALPWLERAERLLPRNYIIEASWGRALECTGRREEALTRLERAAALHPAWKIYELIGLLYGEMDRLEPAGEALRKAIAMEPAAASPHRSLGLWYEAMRDSEGALREYRAALALDPYDEKARLGLARVQSSAMAPALHEPGRPLPTAVSP